MSEQQRNAERRAHEEMNRLTTEENRPPLRHEAGLVLPDRGDGLHWLECIRCHKEWSEKDNGAFAKGSRFCDA